MSGEREFNEINDEELEQVAGGSSVAIPKRYRCPVCGKTATQYYDEGCEPPSFITCISCQLGGRGNNKMYP